MNRIGKGARGALLGAFFAMTCAMLAWAQADGNTLLTEGDRLMERLGDGDPAGAIEKYTAAEAAGADAFEVNWRIARAYFWWSDWQDNTETKITLGKKGMVAAEKARTLQPDRIEGHYFYAINLGEYAKGISILKALFQGLDPKFREAAEKAIEMNEGFDGGGPSNALGRYYYELPWPKRDLQKSKKIFQKTLEVFPNSFRTRYYLAETLIAVKDRKGALKELEYIRTHEPMEINRPDGERYQKRAKKLEESLK